MYRLGPQARIMGLRPELQVGMTIVGGMFKDRGYIIEYKYLLNGVHKRASLHYTGCAVDGKIYQESSHPMESVLKIQITDECKMALGPDFDFVLEDLGTANEHWHLEFQPKESY